MSSSPNTPKQISRRRLLRNGAYLCLGGVVFAGSTTLYMRYAEPAWVDVTLTTVPLPNLPAAMEGFRIALIADLHSGPYMTTSSFSKAVRLLNEQTPDLAILAGDFVTSDAHNIDEYIDLFSQISAKHGVYAVLGNHDVWTNPDYITELLQSVGIRVLQNEQAIIPINDHELVLTGVLDSGFVTRDRADLPLFWSSTLEGLPMLPPKSSQRTSLLIVHNPDVNELLAASDAIDLALCGHTHGGQVQLPFGLGPIYLPSCMGAKYGGGLVDAPASPVYVTRGLGVSGPPIRLNCRPEVAILTLVRA